MTGNPLVSVIIPTYKRAHLLDHVLAALAKQTYRNFEVLIILKPSGDRTEEVVEKYEKMLKINLIFQKRGYILDALNLGLRHAKGNIIAFLDDDAVPFPDWVQRHREVYMDSAIGGVAGNVFPATLRGKKLVPINERASEIIPSCTEFLDHVGRKVWSRPLEGLEDYLVYVSRAGVVQYNSSISRLAWNQNVKSLLGMGANMSVLSKTAKDFRFPSAWILGLSWEQLLGWHIWKKGYTLVFNPDSKVCHIVHGQTLTRNVKEIKRETLRWIERNLLFYRLRGLEKNVSWMYRIAWIMFSILLDIKKLCKDKENQRIIRMKSMFHSEIIGLKWILSTRIGGKYNPLADLRKFV